MADRYSFSLTTFSPRQAHSIGIDEVNMADIELAESLFR